MSPSPDEVVAARIVAELGRQKLLSKDRLKTIAGKLQSGTLKASDWKLEADVALEKETGGDGAKPSREA